MANNSSNDPVFIECVDCNAWWDTHSCGIELTEYPVTITYQTFSKPEANQNWHTPAAVLFYSDDGKVWPGAPETAENHYREYSITRSDAYGWKTEAKSYQYESQHDGTWTDWNNWIEQNKQGSTCSITAVRSGGHAMLRMENAGIVIYATTTLPADAPEKLYVALTGELCTLSDFMLSRESEPIEPGTIHPVADTRSLLPDTEGDLPNIDCSGWWTNHSDGIQIRENTLHITYDSISYPQAKQSWHSPLIVLFSSLDGLVNGVAYSEYSITRSDAYGWSQEAIRFEYEESVSDEFSNWNDWLAANKAGVSCSLTAVKKENTIIIVQSNSGITVTSKIEVPFSNGLPVYIALSGELCAISNIRINYDPE